MITDEEREEIINAATERALLKLPDIIGSLILANISQVRLNRQFYEANPEFAKRKDIVAAIVESIEGSNPGLNYQEILDKAIPIIKDRIKAIPKLSVDSPTKINRNLSSLGDL